MKKHRFVLKAALAAAGLPAVLAAVLVFTGCKNGTNSPSFDATTGQLSLTNIPTAAQGKYLYVGGQGTGGAINKQLRIATTAQAAALPAAATAVVDLWFIDMNVNSQSPADFEDGEYHVLLRWGPDSNVAQWADQNKIFEDDITFTGGVGTANIP
jgi:hypothetical protein